MSASLPVVVQMCGVVAVALASRLLPPVFVAVVLALGSVLVLDLGLRLGRARRMLQSYASIGARDRAGGVLSEPAP